MPETLRIGTETLIMELESLDSAKRRVSALPEEVRQQLSPDWFEQLNSASAATPWITGFSIRDRRTGEDVGSCGFKGPPAEGVAEIAYSINTAHQGRGYATRAAQALTDYAFSQEAIHVVCAHTLPSESASTSVLKKCGFQFCGNVEDPEDGPVWRWEKRRKLDNSS